MTRPVVVLRPEPGCGETVAAARALGLSAIAAPLFAIEPVAWEAPDPAGFDAIIAGSANAFRHGGPALYALTGLPVYAVGDRTAQAARSAGFTVAGTGTGGLQAVIDDPETPTRLLRLAGDERTILMMPDGMSVDDRVVYRARPLDLSAEAASALAAGAVALLHSGAAAHRFAAECDRSGIDRAAVLVAALAPRIADAAGAGWSSVDIAAQVTDSALLALAARLCQ